MNETIKSSLLSSARELYLTHGVKSVSMDDIATKLGISKKTIYNLINTKKDLVHTVVKSYIEDEAKIYNKLVQESKNAIDEIILIARYVQQNLKTMPPSLSYDLKKYHPRTWTLVENQHYKDIERIIKNNIIRGKREGFYRENLRTDILPKLFITMARLVADNRIFSDRTISQTEIHESIILYHLRGIMNNKGSKELTKYLKNESL